MLFQMTGGIVEWTNGCMQNANRGGAWYSSLTECIHIYCKIMARIRMVGKS
jgi:hypothetical protein